MVSHSVMTVIPSISTNDNLLTKRRRIASKSNTPNVNSKPESEIDRMSCTHSGIFPAIPKAAK